MLNSRSNVTMKVVGTKLIIEIEMDPGKVTTDKSQSGKSEVIASTGGNVAVPNTDLKLGLNLYRKA